jgi:anti-sigma factor RsiW
MNCKSTLGMLSAYIDRELGTEERDAVRVHLADCDRCRVEERDLRALKGLLLGVRAPEPAADFEHRLMSQLQREAAVPVRPRFAFPSLSTLRPMAWGYAGLASAAAMAITFVATQSPHQSNVVKQTTSPRIQVAVAQNDYDVYAERYEAYSRPDDFTAGSSLLTTSYAP